MNPAHNKAHDKGRKLLTPEQRARVSDAKWLREQLRELLKDTERNWREDHKRAREAEKNGVIKGAQLWFARAEVTVHYMKALKRILRGEIWNEEFMRIG